MEATQSKQRTHCSVCGQKVVRQDMPYCIYCGNNFDLIEGVSPERKSTKNMLRLAKMPEHADYEPALAADPPEDLETHRWRMRRLQGSLVAGAGLALLGLALVLAWGFALLALGALALVLGTWLAAVHTRHLARRLALPLMKRAAVVTDRRSETELRFNTGITTYFFLLEFDDGAEAEFRYPGRGAHTEPLSKGVTGIAYTRGDHLIAFRQIRV
jgi:hypothetical protein